MVIRRIVTGVCAVCLATPAVAVASPGTDPPKAQGPYGITVVTGPPPTATAKGPYGLAAAGPPIAAEPKGPYGVVPPGPQSTAIATGPYGVTTATRGPVAGRSTTHPGAVAVGDVSSDWRVAAIGEAALLAALALGLAGVAGARNRAPRTVA
jgi:hypothetical protein